MPPIRPQGAVVQARELGRRMIRGIGYLGCLGRNSEVELDRGWLRMYSLHLGLGEVERDKDRGDRNVGSSRLGADPGRRE